MRGVYGIGIGIEEAGDGASGAQGFDDTDPWMEYLLPPHNSLRSVSIHTAIIGYGKDSHAVAEETDKFLHLVSQAEYGLGDDDDDQLEEGIRTGKVVSLGLALVRALQFGAHDRHVWSLLGADTELDSMTPQKMMNVRKLFSGMPATSLSSVLYYGEIGLGLRPQTGKRKARYIDPLCAEWVFQDGIDGGISWSYAVLNADENPEPLEDRESGLWYTCARSPAKTFILQEFLRIRSVEPDARVLVVMNNSQMQQYVHVRAFQFLPTRRIKNR